MRIIRHIKVLSFALIAVLAVVGTVPNANASSAEEIDAAVEDTIEEFFYQVRGARKLVSKSAAVLVFPTVYKAGIGIGGEYGEGALVTRRRTLDYYNLVSASFGFQLGAQARSIVIVFMTPEALDSFRHVDGWKIGVDGSVALVNVGVGASIDTTRIRSPIVAFIFDNKGLMYNLTLEGSKISRIYR